jgi:hypothetical protein
MRIKTFYSAPSFFTRADAYGRVENWSRLSYNYRCEDVENWSRLSYIASSTHDSASAFQFHARFGLRLKINIKYTLG